jgi:uncharacterized membrane protein
MNTDRLDKALAGLIEKGSISSETGALLRRAYDEVPDEGQSRKAVFAEIAIYLGGTFLLISTVLLAANKWADAPAAARTGSLGALSLLLLIVAYFLGDKNPMRLRLTSVLSMVAAISATGAVALFTKINDAPWFPFTVGAAIALYSFMRYRHEILHIGAYGYLFITGLMILGKATGVDPEDSPVYAIYWIILASIWLYLSYTSMIDKLLGYLITAATFFLSAQFLYGTSHHLLSYIFSLLAASTMAWIFLRDRKWPLLLGSVALITFTVGEFVADTLGGSLGALIGLFTAGLALITTSLLALRKLHQQ